MADVVRIWQPWTRFPRSVPPAFGRVAAELQGPVFPSWINGRGSPVINTGDPINLINYFIEYLLREKLSVPAARIDTASFDDNSAYAGSLFLNSDIRTNAFALFDQLAAQAAGIYVRANGFHRFININDTSPTITATIEWEDVQEPPLIRRTGVNEIINQLFIKHSYQPQYGAFVKLTEFNNAASKTAIGETRSTEIECPNLNDSAVTSLGTLLVSAGGAIWAKTHIMMSIVIPLFQYAHLQPGDWIDFGTSFDDHIQPPGGTSWQGGGNPEFLIENVSVHDQAIQLQGITVND